MRHIKLFEKFSRPIISYDFDGVLHRSVSGIHPHDFLNWRTWEPFEQMFEQMKRDAIDHDIVVVTARSPIWEVQGAVNSYIAEHELPVTEVYYTDNMPKLPILKRIGAIKHYDDNQKMASELRGTGIEFQLVDPKIFESRALDKSVHDIALKRNKEFAKKHGFMVQGDYAVLFHGTNKKNMKQILKSGMLKQGTWMTPNLDVAKRYSRQTVSRAADAIIDTFVVYLGSITYMPNEEGGYFQSNEDLHFKDGKYVPDGFKRGSDGDMGLHEGLNEMMDGYQENGIVLIKGNELPSGKFRLYGAHIKKVLSYQRMKMDGEEGQAAKMVLLHDDLFRIKVVDHKLVTGKTMEKFNRTGMKSKKIVLNNNKTPKHWLTTKYKYFPNLFKELVDELRNMSDIEWYN